MESNTSLPEPATDMVCDRAIESEESCCAIDGDVIIPGATISVVGHQIGMGEHHHELVGLATILI